MLSNTLLDYETRIPAFRFRRRRFVASKLRRFVKVLFNLDRMEFYRTAVVTVAECGIEFRRSMKPFQILADKPGGKDLRLREFAGVG